MRATRVISLLLRKTNICIVLTVLDFFFFFVSHCLFGQVSRNVIADIVRTVLEYFSAQSDMIYVRINKLRTRYIIRITYNKHNILYTYRDLYKLSITLDLE